MSVSVDEDVGASTPTSVGATIFADCTTYSSSASLVEKRMMSFRRMPSSGRKNVSRWAAKTLLPSAHGSGVSDKWPTPSSSAASSSPSMTTDERPRRGISRTPIGLPGPGADARVGVSPSVVRNQRQRAIGKKILRMHVKSLKPDRPQQRDRGEHDQSNPSTVIRDPNARRTSSRARGGVCPGVEGDGGGGGGVSVGGG